MKTVEWTLKLVNNENIPSRIHAVPEGSDRTLCECNIPESHKEGDDINEVNCHLCICKLRGYNICLRKKTYK